MEITKVCPIFGVAKVREAVEYYRNTLGFYLNPVDGVFQPSLDEPQGVYGIVSKGNAQIHFQIRRGEIPIRSRSSIERDVYLHVDDVVALHAELEVRGANVIQPICNAPYGFCEFTIEDLNGFRLTFGQIRQ